MTELLEPKVGDFLVYTMWTDTRGYEVVGVTPKGIKLRLTVDGPKVTSENRDGNPYPCVWEEMLPDPDGEVFLLRRRKDGTFRVADWANPLRPAPP